MDASILNAEQAGLFLTCHPNKPYLQEAFNRALAAPCSFAQDICTAGASAGPLQILKNGVA